MYDYETAKANECGERIIYENICSVFAYQGEFYICTLVHEPEHGNPKAYCRRVIRADCWIGKSWKPNHFPANGYDNRIVVDETGQEWVITDEHVTIEGTEKRRPERQYIISMNNVDRLPYTTQDESRILVYKVGRRVELTTGEIVTITGFFQSGKCSFVTALEPGSHMIPPESTYKPDPDEGRCIAKVYLVGVLLSESDVNGLKATVPMLEGMLQPWKPADERQEDATAAWVRHVNHLARSIDNQLGYECPASEQWPEHEPSKNLRRLAAAYEAVAHAGEERDTRDLTDDEYLAMRQAAVDWQYLVIKAGGMARKSNLDAWLRRRYHLTEYAAHTISNSVDVERHYETRTEGVVWLAENAGRPAPTFADYPELDLVGKAATAAPATVKPATSGPHQLSMF